MSKAQKIILNRHRKAMFPTLRQIALDTGVSISTVQNVFYGLSTHSEVIKYLMECAEKSDYDIPDDLQRLFNAWQVELGV